MIRVRPPTARFLFDLGRYLFEESVRQSIPPENPEIIRFLSGSGWRLGSWLKPSRAALILDEARQAFGVNFRTAASIAREAHDVQLQARMEGLIAARIAVEDFPRYIRVEGELPAGSVLLYPSVPGVPLLLSALAWRYPGLHVFHARGLPPTEHATIGSLANTWLNRQVVARRQQEEQALPIRWEETTERLVAHLRAGEHVAAAFDDRAWGNWVRIPFLGRTALLSPDPFTIARQACAPIIPAFIHRERDKTWHVRLGQPVRTDLTSFLRDHAEPWLRSWPGHYAMWLAECRILANMDDHPLFIDYAVDDRWRQWPSIDAAA